MKTKRGFIDYSLDKRATLLALFRGVVAACGADPCWGRAAKYHGERAEGECAVWKKDSRRERKAPRRQRTLEDEDFASLK